MTQDEALDKMADGWIDIFSNPNLELKKEDFITKKKYNQYRSYLFKLKFLKGIGEFPIDYKSRESFKKHFCYFMKYRLELYGSSHNLINYNDFYSSLKYSMCNSKLKESLLPPNTLMAVYCKDDEYYIEVSKYGLPYEELNVKEKKDILTKVKKLG